VTATLARRGRPRIDRLDLVQQVAELLLADPTLSANAIQARVPGRRADVLRAVRLLRPLRAEAAPGVPAAPRVASKPGTKIGERVLSGDPFEAVCIRPSRRR
jgi:hypothetical protein